MYSKNLNKILRRLVSCSTLFPPLGLFNRGKIHLQTSFFCSPHFSTIHPGQLLQNYKRENMKHNVETYASFLIFFYLSVHTTFVQVMPVYSFIAPWLVALISKMSNLIIQGVVISGNHADNFRKWDSTLTVVLNDPYGKFLGRIRLVSFLFHLNFLI